MLVVKPCMVLLLHHIGSVLTLGAPFSSDELVLEEGDSWTFQCVSKASSAEQNQIVWSKDNAVISTTTDPNATLSYNETAGVSQLSWKSVSAASVGLYECIDQSSHLILQQTYLFLNVTRPPLFVPLAPPEKAIVMVQFRRSSVIPCRPVHPNVSVKLMKQGSVHPVDLKHYKMEYDPKVGFTIRKGSLMQHNGGFSCLAKWNNHNDTQTFYLIYHSDPVSDMIQTKITVDSTYWIAGDENKEIRCLFSTPDPSAFAINWVMPNDTRQAITRQEVEIINSSSSTGIESSIRLHKVRPDFEGSYFCQVEPLGNVEPMAQHILEDNVEIIVLLNDSVVWDNSSFNPSVTVKVGTQEVKWVVNVLAPFEPVIIWITPHGEEVHRSEDTVLLKYVLEYEHLLPKRHTYRIVCQILKIHLNDMGNYTLLIRDRNQSLTSVKSELKMSLFVQAKPALVAPKSRFYPATPEGPRNLSVNITSYPQDQLKFNVTFQNCAQGPLKDCLKKGTFLPLVSKMEWKNAYEGHLQLSVPFLNGFVHVGACNANGCAQESFAYFLHKQAQAIFVERSDVGANITLTCFTSSLIFSDSRWLKETAQGVLEPIENVLPESLLQAKSVQDSLGWQKSLVFPQGKYREDIFGTFLCNATQYEPNLSTNLSLFDDSHQLYYDLQTFHQFEEPVIAFKSINGSVENFSPGGNHTLFCEISSGFPPPTLEWSRDGRNLGNSSNFRLSADHTQLTLVAMEFKIHSGSYTCSAKNRLGNSRAIIKVELQNHGIQTSVAWGAGISVGILVLIGLFLLALLCTRRRRSVSNSLLNKTEVQEFQKGSPEEIEKLRVGSDISNSLEPETSESLLAPYNSKLEVNWTRIYLGSLLGSGQFGQVLKARVRGLDRKKTNDCTLVAIKTLKPGASKQEMISLMSELKIWQSIGSHPNLVNLLGACTQRMEQNELYIILEYCPFGNLQTCLVKNRRRFQRDTMKRSQSQFCHQRLRSLDHRHESFSRFTPSEESPGEFKSPKRRRHYKRSTSSVEHQVPKTPQSPTSFNFNEEPGRGGGIPLTFVYDSVQDPLTMGDLYEWSLQVARGMTYLSDKRILHGDLACRNILIAYDGRAKISDFGLSKNIQTTYSYLRKTSVPLPVRWMAPESILDRTYTSASDVWSFGIVLWEIFALGQSPYPNVPKGMEMELGERLRQGSITVGYPEYAPGHIYDIIRNCCQASPMRRTTFEKIAQVLTRVYEHCQSVGSEEADDTFTDYALDPSTPQEPPTPGSGISRYEIPIEEEDERQNLLQALNREYLEVLPSTLPSTPLPLPELWPRQIDPPETLSATLKNLQS